MKGREMKYLKALLLTAVLAVTALGLVATPAFAAPIINTTVDQSLGDCSVTCSLRDAVALSVSGDTIHIPAGTYVLTLGEIFFDKSLTIVGNGARSTVLDGNGTSRIFTYFNYDRSQAVELADLSLINGLATTIPVFDSLGGGALLGGGNLTLRRCRIAGNQAELGGGIFWFASGHTLTIDQSTIADNLATAQISGTAGGGIFAFGTYVKLTNSTLSGNTVSAGAGGGIGGADILVDLSNVTVTANQALSGGGLDLGFANWSIVNSIIAENSGGDCNTSSGGSSDHSLDSDNSCLLTGPGDLPGVAPLLGPLANNGGPTDTHALLAGSPALDAGGTCPATDQRGVTRPQGPACDIGAFEAIVALTPEDQIAALIAQINELVNGGTLAPNKANPLLTKLDQVLNQLDAEQTAAACGQLDAFINQINAYIGSGTLTAADGQALIDATNAILANLGC